jgi:hypothetical protein
MAATSPAALPANELPKPRRLIRRLAPILLLVVGTAAFFALGLQRYVSFEALREHRSELVTFVASHPALAPFIYVSVYALATALSLPGGLVLTVTGGFLFGSLFGAAIRDRRSDARRYRTIPRCPDRSRRNAPTAARGGHAGAHGRGLSRKCV